KLGGSGLPFHFTSSGLGSNRSTWLAPPNMKRKMTDFAFPSKWPGLAASGLFAGGRAGVGPAAKPSRARSQLSARAPQPPPALNRKSRREVASGKWPGEGVFLMPSSVTRPGRGGNILPRRGGTDTARRRPRVPVPLRPGPTRLLLRLDKIVDDEL